MQNIVFEWKGINKGYCNSQNNLKNKNKRWNILRYDMTEKKKGGNNGDILEIVSVRCGFELWGKRVNSDINVYVL